MDKDKDVINIIVDEPVEKTAHRFGDTKKSRRGNNRLLRLSELPRGFIIVSCLIAAAVICLSAAVGFFVPKNEKSLSRGLDALHEVDKSYKEAKAENDSVRLELDNLNQELLDKQTELEKYQKSQDNLDKITAGNISLEEEKKTLSADVQEKKKKLDSINSSLDQYEGKSFEWKSGEYTVGKDIGEGSYLISGDGSIAIGVSGRASVNKQLEKDGEVFNLAPDSIIHLDGTAKLTPQQGG